MEIKEKDKNQDNTFDGLPKDSYQEKMLCIFCKRTKNNGIRCLGICVAESEY